MIAIDLVKSLSRSQCHYREGGEITEDHGVVITIAAQSTTNRTTIYLNRGSDFGMIYT